VDLEFEHGIGGASLRKSPTKFLFSFFFFFEFWSELDGSREGISLQMQSSKQNL